MANLSINLNLLKVKGAVYSTLNINGQNKNCVVIPVEDAHLFVGSKGVYMDLNAFEVKQQSADRKDTHIIKQVIPSAVFKTLSEEQKREYEIVGSLKPKDDAGFGTPQPTQLGQRIDVQRNPQPETDF